jgi:hypothetical protein
MPSPTFGLSSEPLHEVANPHDPPTFTGPLTTYVWGAFTRPIPIAGSIDDFFARTKSKNQFVKLTSPNGTPDRWPIWVRASAVSLLYGTDAGLHEPDPPNVKCYITVGGTERGIAEDVNTAKEAINNVLKKKVSDAPAGK